MRDREILVRSAFDFFGGKQVMTPKELFDVVSMFLQMGLHIVVTFIELFMGVSVALFIFDGIKAKGEHRKRKVVFIVMFIITIILAVLQVLLAIYVCIVLVGASMGIPAPFTFFP